MKHVYIPIEISSRELDAKLLLVSQLVRENVNVIIGKKKQLIKYMEIASPGVFLSIWGGHRNFKDLYLSLSEKGFRIAVMDEEGLITISDDHYLENSVDIETLAHIRLFFCWGAKQKKLLQNYARKKGCKKIHFVASGNVRLDLLRPNFNDLYRLQQQYIKEKYPDCLLVISSFGFARHFDGAKAYFNNLIKSGVIWNEKLHASYTNYLTFQEHNARAFLELMAKLCQAFPEKQIVYRPHPSERLDDLNYLSDKYTNFFVDREHSIIPWLRSVSFTIFNYCTTGPEAQIVGCPNISFRPFKDETVEDDIPYRNSVVFENCESLIDHICHMSSSLQNKKLMDRPQFDEEISGLGDVWAVENVAHEVLNLLEGVPTAQNASFLSRCYVWLKIWMSRETAYVMHKYGQVDIIKINKILDQLSSVGLNDLETTKIGKHIYKIGKK